MHATVVCWSASHSLYIQTWRRSALGRRLRLDSQDESMQVRTPMDASAVHRRKTIGGHPPHQTTLRCHIFSGDSLNVFSACIHKSNR
jgi:hypothetical protein